MTRKEIMEELKKDKGFDLVANGKIYGYDLSMLCKELFYTLYELKVDYIDNLIENLKEYESWGEEE